MKRLLLLFFVLGIVTGTSIQAMDYEDYVAGDETCATGGDRGDDGCSEPHGDEDDANSLHGDG